MPYFDINLLKTVVVKSVKIISTKADLALLPTVNGEPDTLRF